MFKTIVILTLLLTSLMVAAQLKGSGKTITKTYYYQNFEKIYFDDLDGKLEIEIGKPFAISAAIDDNLLPLLTVVENEKQRTLKVYFKGNSNNKMYIEDTHVKIKISMPTASVIQHSGNSGLIVGGITGDSFEFVNNGNASSTLIGNIKNLKIRNSGNGNVNTERLSTMNATLKSSGNGNVYANVSNQITAKASGNSSIRNQGKAAFDGNSSKSGNARLISKK